jgi:ABC-type phosphate/phosphonate transport system substrate-binding protein
MYPFPEWRPATEALWAAVRRRLPDLPELMGWADDDVHALWHDPTMVVSQACGWPLVTELAGTVRVIGAFRYRTRRWSGDHYRSVVVARRAGREPLTGRAAVNSTASLSGWLSLVTFLGRAPADVTLTGSHLASLVAVRDGAAAIASIDAVTFAYAERHRPDLVAGLTVVGDGPRVPCLPLIAPVAATDERIASLRGAFAAAATDETDAAATLLIDGFTPLDATDYAAAIASRVTDLTPSDR